MIEREQLEQAIAQLEAQRATLGDAVVDASIAALLKELTALDLLEASKPRLEGERKLVTVMFADISGFTALAETMDPEAVRELMNECFSHLVPVIERYEGTVDKFMGDAVMALFGAPVAHENDPERALRAALDMAEALAEFNAMHDSDLGLHIGINTGMVIAGGIGSEGRQEYSVMGDAVNLAARLEEVSERGEVLVGPDTQRMAAPLFVFQVLEPVRVKGKADPVTVYRLQGLKTVPDPTRGIAGLYSPLVGRETERQQLEGALHQLQEGQGGRIAVLGEAGVGKSRLVAEVQQSEQGNVAWIEVRALPHTAGMGFWVARSFLYTLVGIDANAPPAQMVGALHNTIERCCPQQAMEAYPYLAHLLNLPLEESVAAEIANLGVEALRQRLADAFRGLLRGLSREQPLVLVWEDLHWADASSLDLLTELLPLSADASLLFVLVFRPTRETRIWPFHQQLITVYGDGYLVLELLPLTRENSQQLVENLLRIESLPPETRRLVLDKSEGNPFFLEELIRSLIDAGLVIFQEGKAVATQTISSIDVPATLQGVIMARIDRLSAEDKHTLQTAAVIGRVFQRHVLAHMSPSPPSNQIDLSLSELQRREFIRQRAMETDLAGSEYIFKHVVTQETAYYGLLLAQRRELHRAAGEAIEALFPDRLEELSAHLAYHFERAGINDKALAYMIQAGDRAKETYACVEARQHFTQALELLEQMAPPDADATAASIREKRGQTCAELADMGAAREDLYWVLDWSRRIGDQHKEAETLLALIGPLLTGHEVGAAFTCAQEAYAIADNLADNRLIARSTGAIGSALCVKGDLEDAHQYLETALTAAKALGDKWVLSDSIWYAAMERYWASDFGAAITLADEIAALAAETHSPWRAYAACFVRGLTLCSLGDYEAAIDSIVQAEELARETPIENGPAELLNSLGWIYQELYDLQRSRSLNEECARVAGELGETESEANAWVNLGVDHLWLSELDRAEECFEAAWDMLEKQFGGYRWRWKTRLLAAWGELYLARGDASRALDYAEQCLELAERTSAKKNLVKGWKLKGEALTAVDRLEEAVDWLTKAAALAEEIGNPPLIWKSRYALGQALDRQGLATEAQQQYDQSADVVESTATSLSDSALREAFLAAGPVRAVLDASGRS